MKNDYKDDFDYTIKGAEDVYKNREHRVGDSKKRNNNFFKNMIDVHKKGISYLEVWAKANQIKEARIAEENKKQVVKENKKQVLGIVNVRKPKEVSLEETEGLSQEEHEALADAYGELQKEVKENEEYNKKNKETKKKFFCISAIVAVATVFLASLALEDEGLDKFSPVKNQIAFDVLEDLEFQMYIDAKIAIKDSLIACLYKELKDYEAQYDNLVKEKALRDLEFQELEKKVIELEKHIKELENQNSLLRSLKKELNQIREEKKLKEEENKILVQKIKDLEKRIADIKADIQKLEEEKNVLENQKQGIEEPQPIPSQKEESTPTNKPVPSGTGAPQSSSSIKPNPSSSSGPVQSATPGSGNGSPTPEVDPIPTIAPIGPEPNPEPEPPAVPEETLESEDKDDFVEARLKRIEIMNKKQALLNERLNLEYRKNVVSSFESEENRLVRDYNQYKI